MSDPLASALAGLPHGPEFRFVDRVLELEPGVRGVGEYRVKGDETFLKGHFPNYPMMPGVLLIEALAQLSGVVAQSDPKLPPLPGLRLTAVQRVKILGAARPGSVLRIEAKIQGRMDRLIQCQGSVSLEGKPLLVGEIVLSGS